jgi:hypothetical protein
MSALFEEIEEERKEKNPWKILDLILTHNYNSIIITKFSTEPFMEIFRVQCWIKKSFSFQVQNFIFSSYVKSRRWITYVTQLFPYHISISY